MASQHLNLLHERYRSTAKPLDILSDTHHLLDLQSSVDEQDTHGFTALDLLLFHVCRKLDDTLELPLVLDSNAANVAKGRMTGNVYPGSNLSILDYQEQVYQCILLLLRKGCSVEHIPELTPNFLDSHQFITGAYRSVRFDRDAWQGLLRDELVGGDTANFTQIFTCFLDPLGVKYTKNSLGFAPLHIAAWRGSPLVILALIKAGANVNKCLKDGCCALHILYEFCNQPSDLFAVTRTLVEAGIDVNITNKLQQNALHVLLSQSFFALQQRVDHMTLETAFQNLGFKNKDDVILTEVIQSVGKYILIIHEVIMEFVIVWPLSLLTVCNAFFRKDSNSYYPKELG